MQQVPDLTILTSSVPEGDGAKAAHAPCVMPLTPTYCQQTAPEDVPALLFNVCVEEADESFEGDDSVFLNFDLNCEPPVETFLDTDLDPPRDVDLDNRQSVVGPELLDTDVDLLRLCNFECHSPACELDREMDSRLKEALMQSQRSRQLGPLLKEELRLKILKKRHDSGQEDIDVSASPAPPCQMTAEEFAKRDRRRAQNRGAAQRFRARKKSEEQEIRKKLEAEQQLNRTLQAEKQSLQQELALLRAALEQHYTRDSCRFFWDQCSARPVGLDSWAADFRQRDLQCDVM